MSKISNLLLRNNYILFKEVNSKNLPSMQSIGTIFANIEYYGYTFSKDVVLMLLNMSDRDLSLWWTSFEKQLKKVTGDDLEIDKFVVYKNFPNEVLSKSASEYWVSQILMYLGIPNEYFTEIPEERGTIEKGEGKKTVLKLANESTKIEILNSLLSSPTVWKNWQYNDILTLSEELDIDISLIPFKENLVKIAVDFVKANKTFKVKSGTDVLRLAAAYSDSDPSLKEVKFKSFKRNKRKYFVNMLNSCKNLQEDMVMRKSVWKTFLSKLHPGDFGESRVTAAYDKLYNSELRSFNSIVEKAIIEKDSSIFRTLESRPGDFTRRLVHLLNTFGKCAAKSYISILPKLTVKQLISIRKTLTVANIRMQRMFPPGGKWSVVQIGTPNPIKDVSLIYMIEEAICKVLKEKVPSIGLLDKSIDMVKIPTSGSDEGDYTRGTRFKIPPEMKFIRTASYWQKDGTTYTWYDNGWAFFDANWNSMGTCSWNAYSFHDGAIFSGDPTNSKEMLGRAAQMIDLYPDKLKEHGVRYAVWSILAYSGLKFSEATVFSALQWGKDPQKGKLFEPSRCQVSFQLKGEYYSKFICMLDLVTNELIFLDANFKASVRAASENQVMLQKTMPAFMEYLETIPSYYDVFSESVDKDSERIVLYTDKDVLFDGEKEALVFKKESDNKYKNIDINSILQM